MSLAVQDYLQGGGTPEGLAADLRVNVFRHPELPLIGFKYRPESPKRDPVVRECRGLVLESESWNVVAKPFRRFFNAAEDPEGFAAFNWSDCSCSTKEDGSLILVYHYAGQWHVNTSGSFGLGKASWSGRTWRELFWATSGLTGRRLESGLTYLFELCTPENKVIRAYPEAAAYLLAAFDNATLEEIPPAAVDIIARHLRVPRVEHHEFRSMDQVTAWIADKAATDQTYEGLVLRDGRERWKIKSEAYLRLHNLFDNGNLFNPKRLVPLILSGESDEAVAYLPELRPHVERVSAELAEHRREVDELWREARAIPAQKDFALAVLPHPLSAVLFQARKAGDASLDRAWRASADLIVRKLYAHAEDPTC